MSDSIVQATVRLTILGDGGRVDVAVPLWADLTAVATMYADQTQCDPVTLHTSAGRPFAAGTTVHAARLTHGDLLVAITGTGLPGRRVRGVLPPPSVQVERPTSWLDAVPPLATVGLAALAAVAGALAGGAAGDTVTAALLVIALLTTVLARGERPVDTTWLATVPALASLAAAVIVATTTSSEQGNVLLTSAVAGLVAAATGAAVRTGAPGVADDWLLGWVATGIVVAAPAMTCLLADWSPLTCWTLVLVAAVVASRLVPSYVVDVPDHVLLDFARLAVTAWSAREQPRRSFRGVVRLDDVESVAGRATRLVVTGSVFTATATVAATGALLLGDPSTSRRIGILMLCAGAGAALVLGGRALRVLTARRLQRTAGTVVLALTALSVLVELGASGRPAFATGAILLGAVLVVVARMAGRGWTSVRWSRLAETAETLASILVFGSLPLATGLFDQVRVLTSG